MKLEIYPIRNWYKSVSSGVNVVRSELEIYPIRNWYQNISSGITVNSIN